jgi:stress-induced morphogen
VVFEDDVALTLLVEGELVLEARATAAAHTDTQAGQRRIGLLGIKELANLLCALVRYRDHRFPKYSDVVFLAKLEAMPTAEEIKQRIEAAIPGAHAEVEDYTGGGDHFRAMVVSPAFAGRSRIEQHKLVYGVFGDEIGGPIHALSLKTQVPQEPGVAGGEQHAAATT